MFLDLPSLRENFQLEREYYCWNADGLWAARFVSDELLTRCRVQLVTTAGGWCPLVPTKAKWMLQVLANNSEKHSTRAKASHSREFQPYDASVRQPTPDPQCGTIFVHIAVSLGYVNCWLSSDSRPLRGALVSNSSAQNLGICVDHTSHISLRL